MDIVVAVLLYLQQERELRQALGGEGLQQWAVLLQRVIRITTSNLIKKKEVLRIIKPFRNIRYLQEFDGLLGDELLLFIPLDGAHDTGPHDADHCLLGDASFLHLFTNVGNDLVKKNKSNTGTINLQSQNMVTIKITLVLKKVLDKAETYIFEGLAAGHLVLQFFLKLFACSNGLLVASEVRELFQPSVCEIL